MWPAKPPCLRSMKVRMMRLFSGLVAWSNLVPKKPSWRVGEKGGAGLRLHFAHCAQKKNLKKKRLVSADGHFPFFVERTIDAGWALFGCK
jgi:hypothetical protein